MLKVKKEYLKRNYFLWMRNGLIKENKEGTFNVKFLRHVIFSYDSSFGDFLELYHFMISVIALVE